MPSNLRPLCQFSAGVDDKVLIGSTELLRTAGTQSAVCARADRPTAARVSAVIALGTHKHPMVTQCVCNSVALIEDTVTDYKSMRNRHHPDDTAPALGHACHSSATTRSRRSSISSSSGLSDHALTPHFRCPDHPVTGP